MCLSAISDNVFATYFPLGLIGVVSLHLSVMYFSISIFLSPDDKDGQTTTTSEQPKSVVRTEFRNGEKSCLLFVVPDLRQRSEWSSGAFCAQVSISVSPTGRLSSLSFGNFLFSTNIYFGAQKWPQRQIGNRLEPEQNFTPLI